MVIYGIKCLFSINKNTAHLIIIINVLFNIFNKLYDCMIRGITWHNAKRTFKNKIIFHKNLVVTLVNTFSKNSKITLLDWKVKCCYVLRRSDFSSYIVYKAKSFPGWWIFLNYFLDFLFWVNPGDFLACLVFILNSFLKILCSTWSFNISVAFLGLQYFINQVTLECIRSRH